MDRQPRMVRNMKYQTCGHRRREFVDKNLQQSANNLWLIKAIKGNLENNVDN